LEPKLSRRHLNNDQEEVVAALAALCSGLNIGAALLRRAEEEGASGMDRLIPPVPSPT